jgi:hypothetical protein
MTYMRHPAGFAGLLLIVAMIAASLVRPAAAEAGLYYSFSPMHLTYHCLDVKEMNWHHGADVINGRCWGGKNQRWRLQPTRDGYYELINWNSQKCLDVAHYSMAHGANVIQGNCWRGGNQQWKLRPTTRQWVSGAWHQFYEIVALHSGKCLDVAHADFRANADVIQGTCWGGANQQWYMSSSYVA